MKQFNNTLASQLEKKIYKVVFVRHGESIWNKNKIF